MGIIEAILDRASVKSVLTFAIGALVVRHIVLRWHERNRIRRLGERGKSLETLVPWGMLRPRMLEPSVANGGVYRTRLYLFSCYGYCQS